VAKSVGNRGSFYDACKPGIVIIRKNINTHTIEVMGRGTSRKTCFANAEKEMVGKFKTVAGDLDVRATGCGCMGSRT
jgi:hypothetical protein